MDPVNRPILYSFRRCPFAMRARMAIHVSGQQCELREVVLRNKPAEMVAASPKATVPVLVDTDGVILEQSLDIMLWALSRNDPQGWLTPQDGTMQQMLDLIAHIDGPFKEHLDRYKYSNRYQFENDGRGVDPVSHRSAAIHILTNLDERLAHRPNLFGKKLSLADVAIVPFVRQFANTDSDWFAGQPLGRLQRWLDALVRSELFVAVMDKYAPWQSNTTGVAFPVAVDS